MEEKRIRLLATQGFSRSDLESIPGIGLLTRWTPVCCTITGSIGLASGLILLPFHRFGTILQALSDPGPQTLTGIYFILLGCLTFTGGITRRSFYDRCYNALFRHIFHTDPIPEHGLTRRIGCAMGSVMFALSGIGFLQGDMVLSFVPAGFMVAMAAVGAISDWCMIAAVVSRMTAGRNASCTTGKCA